MQGLNVTAKGTDFSNYMTKRKYHNIHKGLRQPIKKGTHYKKKTGLPTLETRLPFPNTIIYNLDVVGIIKEPQSLQRGTHSMNERFLKLPDCCVHD